MARQLVPVMRVKVDPNPRGSATTHVTMASANPFEREVLSVRSANKPAMAGLGADPFQFSFPSSTPPATQGMTFPSDLPRGAAAVPASSGFNWGSFATGLTSAAVNIGQSAAVSEIQKKQAQDLVKAGKATDYTSALATIVAARRSQNLPAVNPNVIVQVPTSNIAKTMPWVLGGAAVLAVGAIFFFKGGAGGRGSRRRGYRRRR